MTARVTLYTRAGCHLCDDALDVVAAACAASGSEFELVDIDSQPHLRENYGDKVPVVTVDGAVAGFWRIDKDVLTQALA